ncbi:unnamed protein product [Cuscuta epithymum]|uniref:RNase H type-1 domain-containing protein n=1 Tax=Cuscuta epithymum TaxID=186058 RepID=A0AAV0DI20_9ASTE|nr:unnamed protein product [Cuscuta epithymum]
MENWIKNYLADKDEESWCHFLMILWSLWKRRNDVVWKKIAHTEQGVRRCAESTLHGWREAQIQKGGAQSHLQRPEERWKSPRSGWVKVNVDAATNEEGGIRAWAWGSGGSW